MTTDIDDLDLTRRTHRALKSNGIATVCLCPVTLAGAGFPGVSASPPSHPDEVLREAGFGDTEISEIGNAAREATALTPCSVAKEGQASG